MVCKVLSVGRWEPKRHMVCKGLSVETLRGKMAWRREVKGLRFAKGLGIRMLWSEAA